MEYQQQRNLFGAVRRIASDLDAIERDYKRKNIEHRIREDWGYAFYTGKLVAYVTVLKDEGFPLRKVSAKKLLARIKPYLR
jgi:hypothetical protein